MKNRFGLLCIAMMLLAFASCNKDEEGSSASYSIARINTHGVKYLALGQTGDAAKSEQEAFLYSIDDAGNMQVVAYEYDCDDNGVATELSRHLSLGISQIVPVGDNYLWLVGCRYVCNDYSGFSESMQNRIRDMVRHSVEMGGENFLIRKSDGKIFDLNEVAGRFPICHVSKPGLGRVGMVGIGGYDGFPLDGDLTGDRLRKLGLINQHDGDIYLASGTYQGGLSRLHDNGSTLSVMDVLPGSESNPINIAYAITDKQGHLGTCISYGSNVPHVASIMAPDGTLPAIQGIPVGSLDQTNWPEMRCIGGKFFVSARVHVYNGNDYMGTYDSIYRVDINGSQATAVAVAAGYFSGDEYETYDVPVYISDEENYSWHSGTTLYTFNSNTYQLTQSTLPAGWPQYSLYDAEGHYYEAHTNNGLQSFTVYNLTTLQAENVTCSRGLVPAFNFMKECTYDGGIKAFIESVILADGSSATIVTPVAGPDRGISHLESQTSANNNVIVSTLIPLN